MTDRTLGDALVAQKILTEEERAEIEKSTRFGGAPFEDLLYERKKVSEEAVAKVKAELMGVPYRAVEVAAIPEDLFKTVPRETSLTYRVIPIGREQGMLVVGMLRPDDPRAQEALRFIAKRERMSLGVYLVTPSALRAAWRRYAPYRSEVEAAVKEIGKLPGDGSEVVFLEEATAGEDAPIITIVAATLRHAVEEGASDIHIEPQRTRLRIRMRTDGKLEEVSSLPSALAQPIVSRVKVLARLKLDEIRIPQDGRFRTIVQGRDIDYRVSTFPTPTGEKVAIRVLDPATGMKGLDQIGLEAYHLPIVERALARPYGMVLISGPTGSGKTTTLYGMMQKLNREAVNTVSLEDPVEYFMEGMNQSQVRPEIGYTFASGLRQILRQDPDVIMVGEIRDAETANLAVNAALTGHVVLSTIHTNNSIGVIPRLIDLEVPAFLLSSALNLMLAQRLVLRLCPQCRRETKPSKEIERIIEETLAELPETVKERAKIKTPFTVWAAEPKETCPLCKGKGVVGRVALFELFQMTREVADLVTGPFTEGKLADEARRQDMVTLRQDGVLKALAGLVSIEEVIQETA
ncbi:MAG: Flp pilus assembly complex ATPase component TadA [Candidatus Brennerbacteria bacterium]|nr:Flp pilus assembly complex ATPase component TadA [Candidatus Brennerbacteria bacterium]